MMVLAAGVDDIAPLCSITVNWVQFSEVNRIRELGDDLLKVPDHRGLGSRD
jgi:hypothetical protein